MNTQPERPDLVYFAQGARHELAKLQAMLAAGGVRSEVIPLRDCLTGTCTTHLELAVASADHAAAVALIQEYWSR